MTPQEPARTRAAAVLVPLLRDGSGRWRLVVVRRSEGGVHGGQLAFPGGAHDAADPTLLDTALREAREEIGLEPAAVTALAELPVVEARVSSFRITPFLATVVRPAAWTRDEREIAEVLEPALADLLAPGARRHATDLWPTGGPGPPLPCYPVEGHRLWGVSERILHPLLARIAAGEWPALLS